MFDIALFVFFCVMTYRVVRGIRDEAPLLKEFDQSHALAWLSLLFPMGPLVFLIGIAYLSISVAVISALACYVPALAISSKQRRALERSGTDRTQRAQAVIYQAFSTGLAGVVYVVFVAALNIGSNTLSSVSP